MNSVLRSHFACRAGGFAVIALGAALPNVAHAQQPVTEPTSGATAAPDAGAPALATTPTPEAGPVIAPGDAPPSKAIPLAIVPHSRGGKPLAWDPAWRRFELSDWILTGTDAALTLTFAIVKPLPPPWHGGILFDESVRDSLRIRNVDTRNVARDTTDVLLSIQIMGPFLIDSMATAWWYRGSKDVAREMALIDLETLSVTAAIQGALTTFTARERPYGRTCGGELPSLPIFFVGRSLHSLAVRS